MKLEDIEKMDNEFLDVQTVAEYLGKGPQNVRISIRQGVPWAYMMGQADFRIPRRAFISYHKHGSAYLERCDLDNQQVVDLLNEIKDKLLAKIRNADIQVSISEN